VAISDSKRLEILRLYTAEKLGAKAISSYFNGRPCRTTIKYLLIDAGVYRGEAAACRPNEPRRLQIKRDEKEWRRTLATCLWRLRKGISVEATCREQGWNVQSVWSRLRLRKSYHRFKSRQQRRYPLQMERRRDLSWVSRQYPKERQFTLAVKALLEQRRITFIEEPSIGGLRARCDFLVGQLLIECKVDASHNGLTKALGQCWFYMTHTPYRCVVAVPSDVSPHRAWVEAFHRMGVGFFNEDGLEAWLMGELDLFGTPLIPRLR
jgi:hypothetical protein